MRTAAASDRIERLVGALPLHQGMRVLEVGCGPGSAARAVLARIGTGHLLAIDRSEKAIAQARKACHAEISSGRMTLLCIAAEDLELPPTTPPFDLAFAFRVGALDGRHPELEARALHRISALLTPQARLYIDHGDTVREKPFH